MIGYQGEPGAYSEEALRQAFGARAEARPFADFAGVFAAVQRGRIEAGMIPIENSLAGSVHQNYDLLRKHEVWIERELKLRVRHNLLAPKGATLKTIRRVLSHPQALSQCARFLAKQRKIELVPYFDTAGAARYVAQTGDPSLAAVASSRAAENYGLLALARGIEDDEANFTRFLVIRKLTARRKAQPGAKKSRAPMKTSLVFSLRNAPGAMHKGLAVFALRDIDLYKIESRPLPGSPWQYLFYLDVAGAYADEPVHRAVEHLKEISTYLKVLGSYPRID